MAQTCLPLYFLEHRKPFKMLLMLNTGLQVWIRSQKTGLKSIIITADRDGVGYAPPDHPMKMISAEAQAVIA